MSTGSSTVSLSRLFSRDGWGWFALVTLARVYLVFVTTLAAIAILPMLVGWHGSVVQTGSMQPKISAGDVVLSTPLADDDPVPVGGVVEFRSPARAQSDGHARNILHRIVFEGETDGEYVTAGDANADVDSTPITRGQIIGQGRLLVRFVGLPSLWIGTGQMVPLIGWMVGTAAALVIVIAPPVRRRRPERKDASEPDADPEVARSVGAADAVTRRGQRALTAASAGAIGLVLCMTGAAAFSQSGVTAAFTARTAMAGNSWSLAAAGDQRGYTDYRAVIAADQPWAYYPVDEVGSSYTARDRSGNGRDAGYSWFGVSEGTGPLTRETNKAIALNGTAAATFATPTQVVAPNNFSIELWLKTGSGAGGEIASFGSARTGTSAATSRKLYMGSDGKLRFGAFASTAAVVTSSRSYNDSAWHHVVATFGPTGTALYVDGTRVASSSASSAPTMTGYWRFGGDALSGWPNRPTGTYFSGKLVGLNGPRA